MALKEMLNRAPAELKDRLKTQLRADESKQAGWQGSLQDEGVWTITLRIPISLVRALQKAANDRKAAKTKPASQQDIVAMLLAKWLREEGYLG
jgi:hypothetical protein